MPASTALRAPAWGLTVVAMLAVQLSAALSVGLAEQVGPAGTAWLRLSMGALLFLAIANRDRPRHRRRCGGADRGHPGETE